MQQEMWYVYVVAQKRSFSKAAQALFITQPALSIAVQRVEKSLGTVLFNRSIKPLDLTEAGKVYIDKVRQILLIEEELKIQLTDIAELNTGLLRIGATHYFNVYILPQVLHQFIRIYPGVRVELYEAGAYELKNMLQNREIDLSFGSIKEEKYTFSRYPVLQDQILLAVPLDWQINQQMADYALNSRDIIAGKHLRQDCPQITMSSFSHLPYILLSGSYNLRARCNSFFESAGVQPQVRLETNQFVTAHSMAKVGLGATFLCDRMVTSTDDRLCYYKIDGIGTCRNIDIIVNSKAYLSRACLSFIAMVQEHYGHSASDNELHAQNSLDSNTSHHESNGLFQHGDE